MESLNAQIIQSAIAPENLAHLANIEIFNTIDSTNTYLLNKAKQQAASGMVCLAEQQTQGRGRLGKSWHSPAGANIYCSLLWRFANAQQDLSGLGIAIGVIVVNALRNYGIQADLQLKWPNDVLAMNRKLAGILLERTAQSAVVIGIGVNIDIQQASDAWIDVTELHGITVQRNRLTGLLLNELLAKLPVYDERGLTVFLPDWRKYDALFDRSVRVITTKKTLTGRMCGINAAGELLLRDESGLLQSFRYGEVSVRF